VYRSRSHKSIDVAVAALQATKRAVGSAEREPIAECALQESGSCDSLEKRIGGLKGDDTTNPLERIHEPTDEEVDCHVSVLVRRKGPAND
jgi:hypothetical protein